MDQVEIDEEKVRLALCRTYNVGVPELVRKRLWHRDRQHYAAQGVEICVLATTGRSVKLVNMLSLMSERRVLGLVLLGLLGLIGIPTGARAS